MAVAVSTEQRFEQLRPQLVSIAYAMLGSLSEAEDAVQESWLRLARTDVTAIDELRAWLTTVVGRICLDMLRARKARPVDYVGTWLPEPLVTEPSERDPEHETVLVESVGIALLVVLENLSPPERLSFVLHDVFGMSFGEIGTIIGRNPDAARQLASRARRRIQRAPTPDRDLAVQRRVVDAFLAAAREGNFEALLDVLAPDAVFRFDIGPSVAMPDVAGAEAVARRVLSTAPRFIAHVRPVLVNGSAGAVFSPDGVPLSVIGFTVVDGRIATIDLIINPDKLRHLAVAPN